MDFRQRRPLVAFGIGIVAVSLTLFLTTQYVAIGGAIRTEGAVEYVPVQSPSPDVAPGRSQIDWPNERLVTDTDEMRVTSQRSSVSAPLGPDYANCRFGVGVVRNPIDVYADINALRIGWYLNWVTNSNPPTPYGVEYVQTVRLSQPRNGDGNYLPTYTVTPPLTEGGLGAVIDASPGALWTVGNEPDVWSQDGITSDMYAEAYHEVYHFIKARDPSALVAIGAVVQPSPVRLLYLEMILDHYAETFGSSMPVDVWNIHVYILREVAGSWGAQLPPGVDSDLGIDYPVSDHGNITVFSEMVWAFRRWMADRGQQNKPLIITEMGVLMPEWWQPIFDEEKVKEFMNQSFDFLLSVADYDSGYPADAYRLVQKWNWFSLDDDSVDATDALRWNGMLYNSTTHLPTPFGDEFVRYTGQLLPTVDLVASHVGQQPPVAYSPTSPVTITLEALISNAGNIPFTDTVSVRFYDTTDGGSDQIGSDQVIVGLAGCAMELTRVSVEWPNVAPGAHKVRVEVDPMGLVPEQSEANNVVEGVVLVGTNRVFLPANMRSD